MMAPLPLLNLNPRRWHLGLGVVLLFWGVLTCLAAGIAAVVLAGVVYLVERRRARVRKRWLFVAGVLPFALVAYMWGAFAVYAAWCEVWRDVDLGIGDSWRVPISHGYSLVMIDTAEQAFVRTPAGGQLHFGLTRIGTSGALIAGQDEDGYFVLDAPRGTETSFRSEDDFRRGLVATGASGMQLFPPDAFYDRTRWGRADGAAALLALIPPTAALVAVGWLFMRSGAAER